MEIKNCLHCGAEFKKPYNKSVAVFANAKYCSRKCCVEYRRKEAAERKVNPPTVARQETLQEEKRRNCPHDMKQIEGDAWVKRCDKCNHVEIVDLGDVERSRTVSPVYRLDVNGKTWR